MSKNDIKYYGALLLWAVVYAAIVVTIVEVAQIESSFSQFGIAALIMLAQLYFTRKPLMNLLEQE